MRRRAPTLRREPLDDPLARAAAPVAQPVVQAVRPALPELDRLWRDAGPAPVGWPRDVGRVAVRDGGAGRVQVGARADRSRLVARVRADLRAARAGGEVGVGL